jgi:hypothetical protein
MKRSARTERGRGTLYRFWGEEGQLLYVGSSISLDGRFRGHELTARWEQVVGVTLEAVAHGRGGA